MEFDIDDVKQLDIKAKSKATDGDDYGTVMEATNFDEDPETRTQWGRIVDSPYAPNVW